MHVRRWVDHSAAILVIALVTAASTLTAFSQTTTVRVSPSSKQVDIGRKAAFKAVVDGPGSRDGVDWYVDNVLGGNATVGFISPQGIYTGGDTFNGRTVVVTARSKSTGVTGQANVLILFPPPVVSSVTPSHIKFGPQEVVIKGNWFLSSARVLVGGQPIPARRESRLEMRAWPIVTLNTPGKLSLVVENDVPSPRRSVPRVLIVSKPQVKGVKVSPASASLKGATEMKFVAEMMGMSNSAMFDWAVNGITGGDEIVGKIDEYGFYTAPDLPPTPATVQISATTMSKPAMAGAASVTILPPTPLLAAVFPLGVRPGTVGIALRGSGFMPGAQVLFNDQPLTTTWENSHALRVTITVPNGSARSANVQVVNPPPSNERSYVLKLPILTDPATTNYKASLQDAGRLLEQASFGPSTATIDQVRELGIEGWLDQQFQSVEYQYSELPQSMERQRDFVERSFSSHTMVAPDQLRQRTVFALGQLLVVSTNKVRDQRALLGWQRMLSANAFGNYRELLERVTLNPAMGKYLDLVNSEKASSDGTHSPNENYARELMQLFSIGLVELNLDGTPRLDGAGREIPTYTQSTITEFARALTGWGYAVEPGSGFTWPTREYYGAPLEPFEPMHDNNAKTLLRGTVVPAGGGVRSDLQAVLDNVFQHPNVGPFVSTRLIRHFVTSNPSPAYIGRVATVFNDNGRGTRGDLKAVIRAILLDPEARTPSTSANRGKLKEPILYFTSVARAFDGQLIAGMEFAPLVTQQVGESLLESPTVFNFFSPMHKVGDTGLYGPEFQIYSPVASVARNNWVFSLLNDSFWRSLRINTGPYVSSAGDPARLVDLINTNLFYQRMSPALRDELISTVAQQSDDPGRRAMSAIWLAVTSGEYLVQH
ncbi:MAG: DUF1800 domain-containing protein [Acidobacteriota bacterium]